MKSRPKGFTLLEALLVMVILAILLSVALPAYREHIDRVRRQSAWVELGRVSLRQEQFFVNRRHYAGSLRELGYPANVYEIDTQGNILRPGQSGATYRLGLEVRDGVHLYTAEPVKSAGSCGTLRIDSRGVKSTTGDGKFCL